VLLIGNNSLLELDIYFIYIYTYYANHSVNLIYIESINPVDLVA